MKLELNIDGIKKTDCPPEMHSRGETQAWHYRHAFWGYEVVSEDHAARICNEVLRELKVVMQITAVDFRPQRKSLRGLYSRNIITLFGPRRVATLLHELAHHVVRQLDGWDAKTHGREFRRRLKENYHAFGRVYDVPVEAAAKAAKERRLAEQALMTNGAVIRASGGETYRVTGRARSRVTITRIRDNSPGFTVNPLYMELVESSVSKAPVVLDPVEDRKFNVGDIVKASRMDNNWEVTGYTAEGKVKLKALGSHQGKSKLYPAGRTDVLAERSLRAV